jgi:hypothetical protein
MPSKKWTAPYLTIGDEVSNEVGGVEMMVARLDRSIDPYIAAVVEGGIIIRSGLFPSMSSARSFCEQRE